MTDRTSKDVVLLDCPFCGGPAETDSLQAYRGIATGDIGHAAAVYCTGSCSAQMSLCYADVPDLPRERVLEVLIENWNRRLGVQPVETSDVTRMRNTLVRAGYTDHGGELWKPPLGRRPVFFDENLRLRELLQDAVTNMGAWEYDDLRNWRQRAEAAVGSREEPRETSVAAVAWRYKDSRGHWRYTGTEPKPEHAILQAEPLYTANSKTE